MNALKVNAVRRMSSLAIRGIETRWMRLPECEQGAIADSLAEIQKGDWKKMSLEQKRAAYWIAYGNYGPRAPVEPLFYWKVAGWTGAFFAASLTMWWAWYKFVVTPKPFESKEWEEAERQRGIEQKANPFSGAYAEYLKTQGQTEKKKI